MPWSWQPSAFEFAVWGERMAPLIASRAATVRDARAAGLSAGRPAAGQHRDTVPSGPRCAAARSPSPGLDWFELV